VSKPPQKSIENIQIFTVTEPSPRPERRRVSPIIPTKIKFIKFIEYSINQIILEGANHDIVSHKALGIERFLSFR